jgi:hypothetical protein
MLRLSYDSSALVSHAVSAATKTVSDYYNWFVLKFEENTCALILPSLNPKNILGIFVTFLVEGWRILAPAQPSCVLAGC